MGTRVGQYQFPDDATDAEIRAEMAREGYEFPDDATASEMNAALARETPAPPRQSQMGTGEDTARSGVSGLHQGATGIFGIPGALQELNAEAGGVGLYWLQRAQGMSDAEARERVQIELDGAREGRRSIQLPTPQSVNDAFLRVEPESTREWLDHEPQTVVGEYARTAGQFAPGFLLPGSGVVRTARAVVPAAATETAGQIAREVSPENENAVRTVVGLTSGLLTEGVINARANPPRARQLGPVADPEEFLPRTQGERNRATAGDRAVQYENELRRTRATDAGGSTNRVPEQAQRTMREFDDERAATLQDNLMRRVATRGRDPNTESIGDAGIVVADDLRSGLERMELEQNARYARARELMGDQVVAQTDELGANVGSLIDREFLPAGEAESIIRRIDAQIRSGRATHANIESARQALNTVRGAAMRSTEMGAPAQARAATLIIDELDAFVEARLTGEAQTAIREARGYTREMMNLYGQQARTELSTGHTGRRDPGGRVIQSIIETEMTGDQVIDSIFGVGNQRPSRAALGVVRRLHDRATNTTSTNGYQAPTAPAVQQRTPGVTSLRGGRGNKGGRQFQGPSEAQQRQYNLPANEAISNPALQSLREAFVRRLGRSLENRSQGDAIPAQQMVNDLRAALDGTGSEITPLLFNGEEIALMRRALADLESVAPPRGSHNPSAPGVTTALAERSLAAITGRVLGNIHPVIGSVIEEGVVNARAIQGARDAVRQPPSAAAMLAQSVNRPPRTQPNAAVPLANAAMSNLGDDGVVERNGSYFVGQRQFTTRGEAEAYARRVAAGRLEITITEGY